MTLTTMNSIRASQDAIVRDTNDDATLSRLSTVEAGYLQDPYAELFANRRRANNYKRNPVIHRGTYVRTTIIDKLVLSFLRCSLQKTTSNTNGHQSGSDTRYFRLREYFEVDFSEITARKTRVICQSKLFTESKLGKGGYADAIIRWTGEHCHQAGFVIYEPCEPHDAFGQIMIQNLRNRQIELPGLAVYPSVASQETRFLTNQWNAAHGITIAHAHDHCIPASEQQRIAQCEWLDEIEEWNLLARHYAIVWAWHTTNSEFSQLLNTWQVIQEE
ncbi:S-adenosyl-L-methionine-dependent methyltransferase [Syncephalis plumigaleata]|nr:S-adenosyl-L-methionine-dependent methyltransferase [Syncephalis plumigaleata]